VSQEPLIRKAGRLDDESGMHLLTLAILLVDTFGPEVLTWDFDVLQKELEEHFGNVGPVTWERAMAAVVLNSHDGFWKDWDTFEEITAAICGEPPVFSYTQPPEAEEIAVAMETAARVDRHDYSDEVKSYIVAACLNDGLWYFDSTPMELCRGVLAEFDKSQGIERDTAAVSAALKAREGFYDPPQNAAEAQVNRVREVQLVLSRYAEDLNRQLQALKG
jgi:hypothetical protein